MGTNNVSKTCKCGHTARDRPSHEVRKIVTDRVKKEVDYREMARRQDRIQLRDL